MKLVLKLLTLGVLVFGLALGYLGSDARAQTAAGITVSPVTDDFVINPGETVTRNVRVINPGNQVVTLYPTVVNFGTDNEDGRPAFFTLRERHSQFALSEWVTLSKPLLRIAPGEEENLTVTVRAPLNAEPGGKYGAILFSTEEPRFEEEATQIGVIGLAGTLLLARVTGDVRERTVLEDFVAPTFLIRPPAQFSVLFNNVGNVHSRPIGEINIRNTFGNSVKTLTINEGRGAVLPESRRRFQARDSNDVTIEGWRFDWRQIGRFTATTAITINGEPLPTLTRTFFIIPIWFIIAVVGLILATILTIVIVRRRRSRRQPPSSSPPTAGPTIQPQPRPSPSSESSTTGRRIVMR